MPHKPCMAPGPINRSHAAMVWTFIWLFWWPGVGPGDFQILWRPFTCMRIPWHSMVGCQTLVTFLQYHWYVMLGFVQNMKIFCWGDLFLLVIEAGIFFTETSDYSYEILWSSNIPCSQIWHFCVTYVEGVVHQLWHMTVFFLFFLSESWWVPHVGQEMITLFRTPDFTAFGEFISSPIHCIYITYICQSTDYVYRSMKLVCLPGLVRLLFLRLI